MKVSDLPLPRGATPWLRLARAPNLLTAPGDPLAGALLAGGYGWRVGLTMGVAVALYAGGAMLNDVLDREADQRLRPERPLPAREIAPERARAVAIALLALGVLLALPAGWAVAAIAATIALTAAAYDAALKRGSAGAWAMGACRGQSVLMGAAAAGAPEDAARPIAALAAAALIALYTATVTTLSRSEDERRRVEQRRWGPALTALAIAIAVLVALGADPRARIVGALLAGGAALAASGPAEQWNVAAPEHRRRMIGQLVGLLPLLQAAYIAAAGSALMPLALIWALLAAAHPWIARRFAAG